MVWKCRECGKEIKLVKTYKYQKKLRLTKDLEEIEIPQPYVVNETKEFYKCECSIIGLGVDLEEVADFK